MSFNPALVSADSPMQLLTANSSIQLELSNIPLDVLQPFYSDDERQNEASQAAHQVFDFHATSMDRQQTEQINNAANIGLYALQSLLLQGYYFDGNPKSEVISASETACTAGVKWLLNGNSGAGTAEEYGPVKDLGRGIGINIAEGNINITRTESITNRDFLSSGNGSSVLNENFQFTNLHGRQSSAGMQQIDNIPCRNPNVSSAAQEYWDNKGEQNYIVNVAGSSSNPQNVLTISNIYQASPDFPSSYSILGVSLRNINDSYSSSEYSSVGILRCSKYLRAAQQLLEEVCNVKSSSDDHGINMLKGAAGALQSKSSDDPLHDHMKAASSTCRKQQSNYMRAGEEHLNFTMRKSLLIGMVEQLDRAYQQYEEEVQLIRTSFESATGVHAAAPYTALAKKMISRRFRALRDAIGEHIHDTCSMLGDDISTVPILNKGETPRLRILDQRLRHRRTLQQVTMLPQLWRPPRGLPERSVVVLRAWLFEHFLNPYPKESEKLMLARLTGLTKSQVINHSLLLACWDDDIFRAFLFFFSHV